MSFVFRKAFYIYGLRPALRMLEFMWRRMERARKAAAGAAMAVEYTRRVITDLEFQYSHNRRALGKY